MDTYILEVINKLIIMLPAFCLGMAIMYNRKKDK